MAPYSQLYRSIVNIEILKVGFCSCIAGLKHVLQVLTLEGTAIINIGGKPVHRTTSKEPPGFSCDCNQDPQISKFKTIL